VDYLIETRKIVDEVNKTLHRLGCPELIGKIKLEWNTRFKRKVADACYSRLRIRFAATLWPHMSEHARRNTIIHEVCHIVNRHKDGYKHSSHSYSWRSLMVKMGIQPNRCTDNIDTFALGISKRRKRYRVKCGCKDGTWIGQIQYNRMLKGTIYKCQVCHQRVEIYSKSQDIMVNLTNQLQDLLIGE